MHSLHVTSRDLSATSMTRGAADACQIPPYDRSERKIRLGRLLLRRGRQRWILRLGRRRGDHRARGSPLRQLDATLRAEDRATTWSTFAASLDEVGVRKGNARCDLAARAGDPGIDRRPRKPRDEVAATVSAEGRRSVDTLSELVAKVIGHHETFRWIGEPDIEQRRPRIEYQIGIGCSARRSSTISTERLHRGQRTMLVRLSPNAPHPPRIERATRHGRTIFCVCPGAEGDNPHPVRTSSDLLPDQPLIRPSYGCQPDKHATNAG